MIPASAGVITVGFKDADYNSIQNAVDNASIGDLIVIQSGIYSENVLINKPLTLKTVDNNSLSTIIQSTNSSNHIFHIISSNTSIIGFKLTAKAENRPLSGIYIDDVDHCLIQNNTISNVEDGILLSSSHENEIEGNSLFSNNLHGISISNSNNNTISENKLFSNRYGIIVQSSSYNTISNNNASANENYGIALFNANGSAVKENIATKNKYGICLTSAFDNKVENNNVVTNIFSGAILWKSEDNTLENNNLSFNRDSGLSFVTQNRNNEILNNEISYNNRYGIFLNSNEGNIIKNNTLINNEKGIQVKKAADNHLSANTINDRLTLQKLMYSFLILISIGMAFYLKKKSLLLKSMVILTIVALVVFLGIIAWYFPFESGIRDNVEITNFQWVASETINENYTRGKLSMDLVYNNKDAYPLILGNTVPIDIRISSRAVNTSEDFSLLYKKSLTLEYLETYRYNPLLDFKNEEQNVLVEIYTKRYYEYPNPVYGDTSWEQIGMAVANINPNRS
ncbi:right-handed parallel beta-helix repeat-containing protein [Methanococcoides burtonii]|uniref:right-handed parallel beta-helix repeat-containing protein n=1 Tax=Methanococcoides burtonii TaxID=29291 RepID=UPI000045E045|nr:NosD domain-containing protein [Methanococcoides burtonii]